jgi:arylsulfatase A-like enzyme
MGSWLGRAALVVLVAVAGFAAWLEGGGADARVGLPRPEIVVAADGAPANDPGHGPPEEGATNPTATHEAYEVKMRLADALGDAVIDVPNLVASQPYFQAHWRKLRGPWLHPAGVAGQLVTTIALRTSAQPETQWATSASTGQSWVPDVRVWNMNEGSFDQREAIYAPAPATLTFHVLVPHGAHLRFWPAVITPLPTATVFDVTLIDGGGQEHTVSETRIPPGHDRRWLDGDADLGAWAGQKVDLRLRTATAAATAGERRSPPPADGDAGATEHPLVPPMALALWGDPVVVSREPTRVPYNVVWIVVDALRPDIAASLHDLEDDAAKLAALRPPLDALLPAVPGLMPAIDGLAARGVHFPHAWSAASWTRPGTLAMLTGERSSEVGIDTTNWVQSTDRVARYYASDPPLLPRLLQKSGMTTAAFVNNFFMAGYANVGLDMGFERITDHRHRTRDTALITYDALAWLEAYATTRFFLFVNYNSPHEPYDPPKEMLARIPAPPAAPRDGQVRAYMAEAAKDDTAIGVLLDKLDTLGLTRSTLVVLSSDHGETLSAAHDGFGSIGGDKIPVRFHHAVGNFEETTRVPIVMALPGVADGGRAVHERVRTIDIAPTILEIEGLEPDARMSGRSLLPLVRGRKEAEPRVVVSEGRMSRAVLWDRWRFVAHEAPAHPQVQADGGRTPALEDELYDLEEDPGERHNVARLHPDVVAEMHARLTAALANVPAADAPPPTTIPAPATVHFRFSGAGRAHSVTGALTVGDEKHASITVAPSGIARDAIRTLGRRVDFAVVTLPDALLGFDVRVDPPGAPLAWEFFLDDAPWPDGATFGGPFGLPAVAAARGITTAEARAEVYAPGLAVVDPARDLGVFVTRDTAERAVETAPDGPANDGEGAKEMQRVLRDWGYAHGSK